jgi:hypothetical protein
MMAPMTSPRSALRRRASFASALVVASLAAAPARAQDDDHQRAARAFAAARADIDAGNCRSAIPKLEESLSYEPSVGAHLSMADCYEQIDLLAAWRELKEAATLATARGDDRATVARDRAAELEPRLATVKLVLPAEATEAANLEVRLDGNVVKPSVVLGGIIATTRGVHDVEIVVPRKKAWRQRVVIETVGTPVPVIVGPEDQSVARAPIAAGPTAAESGASSDAAPSDATPEGPGGERARRGDLQRTVGIAAGGVGVAGIVIGTIAGIVALSKNAQLRDACGGDVSRCTAMPGSPSVAGPRSGAQSAATVSTVGFVVGGVLVAGGVAIYFLAPHDPPAPADVPPVEAPAHEAPAAARGNAPTLAMVPLLGDRVLGLSLNGDF